MTDLEAEEIDEGDAVWIFEEHNLQPRRGTCVAVEGSFLKVTVWDDDTTEHEMVDRGRVRRMQHH